MNPPPPPGSIPSASRSISHVILGVVIGMFVGCGFSGVAGFALMRKKERDVRRGWNLVPVVVAAQDLPEGTVVTFDMISQRSVPEQFVTNSVVKPDSASYIVNQRLQVPMYAGDPMLWSHFETEKNVQRLCGSLVTDALNAGKSQELAERLRTVSLELRGTKADADAGTPPPAPNRALPSFLNVE